MAWRGESWAQIVARTAAADPRAKTARGELEDREALAARARPWTFQDPRIAMREGGLRLGAGLDSVEIAFAQLLHVEPVDPWPSLALGWVDRGEAYQTVLSPREPGDDAEAFAAIVEAVVVTHAARLQAVAKGWLQHSTLAWERVEALPGERDEAPSAGGYRMAPGVADEVVARRKTAAGESALWTWVWARLLPAPRRVDPKEVVLTKRYVYVRTRRGERLRMPVSALRASWLTADGDAIYVFGRSTELLLVRQEGCELAPALDACVPAGGQARSAR